jgi:uncharacterized membrane protein YhaH (DUF805 family)
MRQASANELLTFFFRPAGRIGRTEYALGVGMLVAIEAALVTYFLASDEADPVGALLLVVIGLPVLVAEFVLVAKRCHDIGLPGLFVVLLFVPVLGVGWLLLLAGMPGSPGLNPYGAPPGFDPD